MYILQNDNITYIGKYGGDHYCQSDFHEFGSPLDLIVDRIKTENRAFSTCEKREVVLKT